jgi:hypothetical protein
MTTGNEPERWGIKTKSEKAEAVEFLDAIKKV